MVVSDAATAFLRGGGDGGGNGSGGGSGSGGGEAGWGFGAGTIKSAHGLPVHYIDGIPTIIKKAKGSIATGATLDKRSFAPVPCCIARHGGYFAHGKTAKEAVRDAQAKHFASLDIDAKIREFVNKFAAGETYGNKQFFDWHFILTGSCEYGRKRFMDERGLTFEGSMAPEEFIDLIRGQYGWEHIRELEGHYATRGQER